MSRIKAHWLLLAILVAHLFLGVFYSVAIPLWEAHDEVAHYGYVNYLSTRRSLPGPGERTVPKGQYDELTQPPLYYFLGAVVIFWVNTGDGLEPVYNPYVQAEPGHGGANLFIHYDNEGFPYRGTVLGVHLVRLLSVLISTIGIWFTYLLGMLIFPQRKELALGATALHAFSPEFLFIGSVITNDILISVLGSAVLFLGVKLLITMPKIRDFVFLGLLLGLAFLSKYNAVAFVPLTLVCGLVGIVRYMRARRSWKYLLVIGLSLLGLVITSGWWFMRAISLYGYPATRRINAVILLLRGLRQPSLLVTKLHWEVIPEALKYGFRTFWASFGWANVWVSEWMYLVIAIFCGFSLIGLAVFLLRASPLSGRLACLTLIVAVLLVGALAMYPALEGNNIFLRGRYMLPAISAFDILLFLGLAQLLPERFAGKLALLVGGAMFIWSFSVPFSSILPVYASPPVLSEAESEEIPNPLHANFGDKVELVGYELESKEVAAGQDLRVTLYWRCLAEMDQDYTLAVYVLGPDYEVYGGYLGYPGRGNYATSRWKKDQILKDTYVIGLSQSFPAPAFGQLKVALYLYPSEKYLLVSDAGGESLGNSVTFGRFKVAPREAVKPIVENPTRYRFGSVLALIGYGTEPREGGLVVRLYWQALQEPGKDYTVFLHLVNEKGAVVSQMDSQPRGGNYPTSVWERGEVIVDEHYLPLPADAPDGEYGLLLGLYLLDTMERLPAFDAEGTRLSNDQVVLPGIEMVR